MAVFVGMFLGLGMFSASLWSSLCYGYESGRDWVGDLCMSLCKKSVYSPNEFSDARMRWGEENEMAALNSFVSLSGLKVQEQGETKRVPWKVWGQEIAVRSDGESKTAVLEIKSPFLKGYEDIPSYYIIQMTLEMIAYNKKKAYFIVDYNPHGWMKYAKYLHRHQMYDKIRSLSYTKRQGSTQEWEMYLKNPSIYPKTPKKTSFRSFNIYQLVYSKKLVDKMKAFLDALNQFSFMYLRFVVTKPFMQSFYHIHMKDELSNLHEAMRVLHEEILSVRSSCKKVFKRSRRSPKQSLANGKSRIA